MKPFLQIILIFFSLLIASSNLRAQSAEKEALNNLIINAWAIRDSVPEQAFVKASEVLTTVEKLEYSDLQAKCLYVMSAIKYGLEEFVLAHQYGGRAKVQYQANDNLQGYANTLDLLASITSETEDFVLASQYYQKEIDLLLANPTLSNDLAAAYLNYGSLFQDMEFFDLALDYYEKAEAQLSISADENLNTIKLNKAQVYHEIDQPQKAILLTQEAYSYFITKADKIMMAKSLNLQGVVALSEERFVESTQLFSEALSIILRDAQPNLELRVNLLVNLSKSYLGDGKSEAAIKAIHNANFLALTKLKTPKAQLNVARQFYEYYKSQSTLDSAIKYFTVSYDLQQEIYDKSRDLSVLLADTELKVHRNTIELKDKEQELSKAIDTQSYLYLGLMGLGLLLLVIGGAFWQYGQKKKTQFELMTEREKNQEQLLQGVIKEQELKSISYIIEGQESEKKRIAEELHDGLGGTLAAVRISLEQFRRRLNNQDSLDLQDFDYAFDLLREATEDVRRISHDMGAIRLKHGGLVTALEDMCRNLSRHQSFIASLDTEGIEMLRINSEVEFHLYRIAQELFQNIIKHANAHSVKIQLTNAGGRLHLYMWDDGNGFDVDAVADGMGMQNLKIRTQQLNGKIHIDSTIGKGTYTHISLPV